MQTQLIEITHNGSRSELAVAFRAILCPALE